jgi:hypothetical protein
MFPGILNWVWNVFCPEKNTCCFVGVLEVFGIEETTSHGSPNNKKEQNRKETKITWFPMRLHN